MAAFFIYVSQVVFSCKANLDQLISYVYVYVYVFQIVDWTWPGTLYSQR